jgi:6-phosphogluconolactonase (cycloisomerase 2 family)
MKFSKPSQLVLVSITGLLIATLLSGCQIITIDYLFVASSQGSGASSGGEIDIFAVDSESGALRKAVSPVSSGGVSPIAFAVTPNYANLYVANQGSENLVQFAIANNGSLAQKSEAKFSAPPVSIAVNAAGTYLYAVTQPSSGTPLLEAFALSSDGSIGTGRTVSISLPGYASDFLVPTGVVVLASNDAVFVTVYDQSAYNPGGATTSTANPGWVFGFSVGSGGSLVPSANSPFKAGVKPTALAADPTNRFVYVTDYASNELIGYSVQSGYELKFLINGPFKTGNEPQAVVIDPRGKYIYVANVLDSSVSAFAIDLTTGTPSAAVNVSGSATNSTDTQPVSILVDPALGRFVYTANHLGDSVSGFRLDPNTGTLTTTQATPYPCGAGPNAVASVPHGSHSLQTVTP